MELRIKFVGGPLDGSQAYTDAMDEARVFFESREKRVFLYTRIDELVYVYEPQRSVDLTERYDEVLEYFAPKEAASLSFIEVDEDEEEDSNVAD